MSRQLRLILAGLCAGVVGALAAVPASGLPGERMTETLHGSGSADGSLVQTRHRDSGGGDPGQVIADDTLTLQAHLSFSFGVDGKGALSGNGVGQYTKASWTVAGSRGGSPFSCSPALSTAAFTVKARGTMIGGVVTARFSVPDAQEVAAATDCGAGYRSPVTTSHLLADSLTKVAPAGVDFPPGDVTRPLSFDENKSGGQYTYWLVQHRWTVTIAPPVCPPNGDMRATQEYAAASQKLATGERSLLVARRDYDTWMRRGRAILSTLRATLVQAQGAARQVARDPAGTVARFRLRPDLNSSRPRDILRRIDTYRRELASLRQAWKAARDELIRSKSDAELAQTLRTPCEPDARTVAAAAARRVGLINRKLKLIAAWDREVPRLLPDVTPWRNAETKLSSAQRSFPGPGRISARRLQAATESLLYATQEVSAALRLESRMSSALTRLAAQLHAARAR